MAVKRTKAQLAYGIGDALIPLTPLPIIAVRDPFGNDTAELGTMWVNRINDNVYVITKIVAGNATWTVIS